MSVSESDRDVRRTIQSRKAKQSCQGNKRERQRSGVWGRLDQLDERWVSEGVNGEGRWEGGGGGANDRRGRLEEQSERSSSTATKYLSTTLRRNTWGTRAKRAKCVVKSARARVCVCVCVCVKHAPSPPSGRRTTPRPRSGSRPGSSRSSGHRRTRRRTFCCYALGRSE